MTPLVSLWLPILLSAVGVFLGSSVLHMFTGWHKSDYLKVPNEDRVMDMLRPLAIPPGDYMMPRPESTEQMRSPAFVEYTLALWPMSIWYRRSWITTLKATVDGLIYALLTAGVFAWLWPH